jgi:hypothetical protein
MRTYGFADLAHCLRGEREQRRVAGGNSKLARFVFGLVFFGFCIAGDVTAALGGSIDYVYLSNGNFGTMDLQTGAFTLFGPGGAHYQDMTSQSDGPLYAADISTRLLTIDANAGGIASIIGTMGNNIGGLRFDESGTLFGFSPTDLYTVNAANADVTHVGAFGIATGVYYDGAFNGNTMYLQDANGPGTTSNLYTVNTNTGAASSVGNIGYVVSALDFENGTLYGFTAGEQIVTIDTTTGAGTFLVNQSESARVISATSAAVPEPGSLCLLCLGLAGLAARCESYRRFSARRTERRTLTTTRAVTRLCASSRNSPG